MRIYEKSYYISHHYFFSRPPSLIYNTHIEEKMEEKVNVEPLKKDIENNATRVFQNE